jgi:RNA polymerase sigma factor (sigma-70 family)
MSDSPGQQFGAKIEPYLDRLFRAAYRLTGNSADAQDLVQDTCVRAFSRLEKLDAADSPLGWLMRVQYNLFIDGARQRQRELIRPLEDDESESLAADESMEPDRSLSDLQGLSTIDRAWSQLTKEQRALLGLLVEGYSVSEIQAITGLGLNVVNARLHRARRSLSRHLRSAAEHEAQAAAETQR